MANKTLKTFQSEKSCALTCQAFNEESGSFLVVSTGAKKKFDSDKQLQHSTRPSCFT